MCIRDRGVSEDILADLRANFEGECSEVGMYLAMSRVAHREGYPEIGLYWEKAAYEEAEHAAKFAELLGEEMCIRDRRHPFSTNSGLAYEGTYTLFFKNASAFLLRGARHAIA